MIRTKICFSIFMLISTTFFLSSCRPQKFNVQSTSLMTMNEKGLTKSLGIARQFYAAQTDSVKAFIVSNSMSNALSLWHNSPSTDPIVYDYLAWSGDMRSSSSLEEYIDNHPNGLAFESNSNTRNNIETGSHTTSGGFLPTIGNNTCL